MKKNESKFPKLIEPLYNAISNEIEKFAIDYTHNGEDTDEKLLMSMALASYVLHTLTCRTLGYFYHACGGAEDKGTYIKRISEKFAKELENYIDEAKASITD